MAEVTEPEPKNTPSNEPEPKKTPEKEESKALTQEDVNKLIEAARKQEKDKLYETITGLKDQVNTLTEAQKKEQKEKEDAEERAKKKLDDERKAKLSGEERLAEQLQAFEERLASEAREREQLKSQLEREKQDRELDQYRSKLLQDAGEEIISDLVQGQSREELDKSVATAKEKYQHYFKQSVDRSKGPGGKLPKPADPDPEPLDEEEMKGLIPKIVPDTTVKSKRNRKDILEGDPIPEDYVKNREEILAKVGELYRKTR